MNRIVHLFKNVDMRCGHDGLTRVAHKGKVRLDTLGAGEHCVFLNARLNKIKLYSAQGLLSYYRAPANNRLNLNMIEMLPACFNAEQGMDWAKADRLAVEKLLRKNESRRSPNGRAETQASAQV